MAKEEGKQSELRRMSRGVEEWPYPLMSLVIAEIMS